MMEVEPDDEYRQMKMEIATQEEYDVDKLPNKAKKRENIMNATVFAHENAAKKANIGEGQVLNNLLAIKLDATIAMQH